MSEIEARAKRRALMAFNSLTKWRQQNGAPQLEHLLLAAFSGAAEVRGLWAFMIERGLATEAQHQDYLDKGWQLFLDQMTSHGSKIQIATAGRG